MIRKSMLLNNLGTFDHVTFESTKAKLANKFKSSDANNTECSPGNLPEAMKDREGWREMVRYIPTDGTTR